jgi:hypothetical protein
MRPYPPIEKIKSVVSRPSDRASNATFFPASKMSPAIARSTATGAKQMIEIAPLLTNHP